MDSAAELIVLDLKDMSRCLSCRRLITQRRILGHGCCKCGARKVNSATYLNEDDLLEIEEDYGWNVKITGVTEHNVAPGLLQTSRRTTTPKGTDLFEINEKRLHSSKAAEYRRFKERERKGLIRARWFYGLPIPGRFRNVQTWNDFLKSFRKRYVHGFGRREGMGSN